MTDAAVTQPALGGGVDQGADPLALAQARAAAHGLALMRPEDWPASPSLPPALSHRFLREMQALPLGRSATGAYRVAVADPGNAAAIEALALALGAPLELSVASAPAILGRLQDLGGDGSGFALDAGAIHIGSDAADSDDPEDSALDAPAIAALDRLLAEAVQNRATDLHLEPGPQLMTVRHRVDGMLRVMTTLPPATGRAVVSRLKILAGLNIAERRLAQDGHIRAQIGGQTRDLRCATLPFVDGEGAAIRILAGRTTLPRLAALGLRPEAERDLRAGLGQSHGLILVTGPTGSGKTTTLAAATAEINAPHRKILSVEDPVEYRIDGISQMQVNPQIGLTFAGALRSFLRADPDVILVGEVRDAETARITVQAALTGHLVLTTLHTNSAASAVMRLVDMGIEPFLIAATLRCSVGQRLVRMLCRTCRTKTRAVPPFPDTTLRAAGLEPGAEVDCWVGAGCEHCGHTGYYGRMALFEVMPLTEDLRGHLLRGAAVSALHNEAVRQGMLPLIADGVLRALAGQTSFEEVLRVVQDG
jgi:general secretion pathway protein E